ncbi:MAG: hypothetical protein QME52_13720 [Bacteroidota bacterium]|nr:hypothetical protein [Bacteroidota bacterium]
MKKYTILVLVLLFIVSLSNAQIPKTISYQGVLTDMLGNPVLDSLYSTTFRFFSPESVVIWEETKQVQTKRGLFSVTLGSTVTFPESLKFDKPYRLGIQISGEPQLVPLIPLNSVGYSLSSLRTDTAKYAEIAIVQPNSIDSTKLAENSVTSDKITNQAITSEKIQDQSIETNHLSPSIVVPNADSINGISASRTQTPNSLYPLNSIGGLELYYEPSGSSKTLSNSKSGFPFIAAYLLSSGLNYAIRAVNTYVTGKGLSGEGESIGVEGISYSGFGLKGISTTGTAVYARSEGPGRGIEAYTSGDGTVIEGLAVGNATAGRFTINNTGNTQPAVSASSNGSGDAILAWNSGTGHAGNFTTSNSKSALYAYTNGPGDAIEGYAAGGGFAGKFTGNVNVTGNLSVGGTISGNMSGAAGGDLSGSYPNPNVVKIQNRPVSTIFPNVGQVLKWDGSQWKPDQDLTGGGGGITSINSMTGPAISITGGSGISISNGSNIVTVNNTAPFPGFSGTGSSNYASRSDHNHWGQYWSGSGIGLSVYSSNNAALTGESGTSIGVYGQSSSSAGISGSSTSSFGVFGTSSNSVGVCGYTTRTSGDRGGGYFSRSDGNYVWIAANISGVNYKIIGNGLVSTVMDTRQGKKGLFAPESPEPWVEDIGSGQLLNGFTHIELDPVYLDCITVDEKNPIKVFVQLTDEISNNVYIKKTTTGFDVIEMNGGKSNVTFDYRVIGKWKGYENVRFSSAPEPLEINIASPTTPK